MKLRKPCVEQWKSIFNGDYSVSNFGRIRRDAGGQGAMVGRILRSDLYTKLTHKSPGESRGTPKTYSRHKLVASAFIGPCPPGKEVNHKDGVTSNCYATNLEYVTHKQNMEHASRTGLIAFGERHGKARLTEKQARAIRNATSYGGAKILADKFGVTYGTAHQIWHQKIWKHLK